jgi:hypothetical protein
LSARACARLVCDRFGQPALACAVVRLGVKLGDNASVEDVAAHWEQIVDMSEATPMSQAAT